MDEALGLQGYEQAYEAVMNDESRSTDEKDIKLAALMTRMEIEFRIPLLRDVAWEQRNDEVITLYRKISYSRTV